MSSSIQIHFGKYKGQLLDDIPANYLKWLSEQDWIEDHPTIKKYIDDNMKGIEKQIADGRGEV